MQWPLDKVSNIGMRGIQDVLFLKKYELLIFYLFMLNLPKFNIFYQKKYLFVL
jgi:hypothetical protein